MPITICKHQPTTPAKSLKTTKINEHHQNNNNNYVGGAGAPPTIRFYWFLSVLVVLAVCCGFFVVLVIFGRASLGHARPFSCDFHNIPHGSPRVLLPCLMNSIRFSSFSRRCPHHFPLNPIKCVCSFHSRQIPHCSRGSTLLGYALSFPFESPHCFSMLLRVFHFLMVSIRFPPYSILMMSPTIFLFNPIISPGLPLAIS